MRIENDTSAPLDKNLSKNLSLPPLPKCPDCGGTMRLVAVMPSPSKVDEITYRCNMCRVELKRLSKPIR
jgi:hypothetical protein